MKTYESKIVDVLIGANSCIISSDEELNTYKAIMKNVGLIAFGKYDYNSLYDLVIRNARGEYNLKDKIILEYQNGKGFTFGYSSIDESIQWYGIEPYTVDELQKELINDFTNLNQLMDMLNYAIEYGKDTSNDDAFNNLVSLIKIYLNNNSYPIFNFSRDEILEFKYTKEEGGERQNEEINKNTN